MRRYKLEPGTPEYGHAFEHLVMQEIIAYLGYKDEVNRQCPAKASERAERLFRRTPQCEINTRVKRQNIG